MKPDSPRMCGSCGEALAPGASFCRACGTRYEQPTCDACGSPVAAGTSFCRACGAPIAAGQAKPTAGVPESTLVRPAQPAAAPPPQSPPSPSPARPGRRRAPLLIAAAILLLGAGAAAAIVLAGGGDSSPTTVAADGGNSGATSSGGDDAGETEDESESEGEVEEEGFPLVGKAEMEEQIAALLVAYHEDVVEHDFPSAWALLSVRKHRQNLAEYGYTKWKRAQASLSDYLSPAGLRARIDSLEGEGVARVRVTGMGWSAPQSPCSEWGGLTWVKYEGGEWTYDPGYSTTSARRSEWQPRAGELLGANC